MGTKKKNKNSGNEQPQSTGQASSQSAQQASNQPSHNGNQPSQPRYTPQSQQSSGYNRPAAVGGQRRQSSQSLRRLVQSRAFQLIAVLIIASLPSLYFYNASQRAIGDANNPTSAKVETTAQVVKQVSRHILLPSGEQPTVATVSDASKVRSQAFFANAASGDKVLVYAQAKKAFLYRPSVDRLIEVAPLAPNKTSP